MYGIVGLFLYFFIFKLKYLSLRIIRYYSSDVKVADAMHMTSEFQRRTESSEIGTKKAQGISEFA
jgi:hypothetical protein